jgi:hypothetical protein
MEKTSPEILDLLVFLSGYWEKREVVKLERGEYLPESSGTSVKFTLIHSLVSIFIIIF